MHESYQYFQPFRTITSGFLVDDDRAVCMIVDPGECRTDACTRSKQTAGSRKRSSLTHHHQRSCRRCSRSPCALIPILTRLRTSRDSQDKGTTQVVERRRQVSTSSGGSFHVFRYARSHFRASLFLQQTLSVLWRHAVFWRLWKAV